MSANGATFYMSDLRPVLNGSFLQASPGWRLYHDWPRRLELAHQAAAAVEFMHSHNVVHRDLTSNNLLVTDKWEAKVSILHVADADT